MDFTLITRVMEQATQLRNESPQHKAGDDSWPIESYERVPVVIVEPMPNTTDTGWWVKGARSYRMAIAGYGRPVATYRLHRA